MWIKDKLDIFYEQVQNTGLVTQLLLKSIQVVQVISVVGCLNIKKISFYKHDFWEIIGFETVKGTEVVVKSDF